MEKAQAVLIELTAIFGLKLELNQEIDIDPRINNEIYRDISSHFVQLQNNKAIDFLREELYSADIDPGIKIDAIVPDFDSLDNNLIIDVAINLRDQSRDNKDWATSDFIRDVLSSNGIIVEDSDQGTTWHWK